MIQLHIPKDYAAHATWENQLKEWCAAHKIIIDEALEEPEIREKEKVFKGSKAIDKFLKEYKSFMDDWYDCRCDRGLD
jgi:hypothetical protein